MAEDRAYYRFIRPLDWYIKPGEPTRLSSAAFKDGAGGYSVDADFGRPEKECIRFLFESRTQGENSEAVMAFAAEGVVACGIDVIDEALPANPYHKVLVDDASADRRRLNANSKVKCLQRLHQIVFEPG